MALFSKNVGIDIGTSSVQFYKKGSGVVLDEPSVVAIDRITGKVLSVGFEASEMIGRAPDSVVAVRPVRNGVIADFDITREMLRSFMHSCVGGMGKPKAVVAVPVGITNVEKRAIEEAIVAAGAKSAVFVEEAMAAALGAGLPVDEATGSMVADIGGGTTEVAVISLGNIVSSKSVRVGGNALDTSIINYIKKNHGINIGDRMAEQVKIAVGSVFPSDENKEYTVHGRDVSTGLPNKTTVTADEIREAMRENILRIMEAIKATLEQTPPELRSDIVEKGVVLSGAGARLRGLEELIKEEIHIPAVCAEDCKNCVVRGTGAVLARLHQNK